MNWLSERLPVCLFVPASWLIVLEYIHLFCSSTRHITPIFIKYENIYCGVPIAFVITRMEPIIPPAQWLRWLKISMPLESTPLSMIDYSKIEVATFKAVLTDHQIRFCH